MEVAEKDEYRLLAEQSIGKLLLRYAIPAIVATTASSLYNIVDGIFIGRGIGAESIMGLALINPIMNITIAFSTVVGVGGATLMAICLGQKDYTTAHDILDNVLFMNIVLGILLGMGLYLNLDTILTFFGASKETLPPAKEFMSVILSGTVITNLYFGLNAMLRSTGRPSQAMQATVGTVLCNVILAPIFIFVFHLEMKGAALATILSQFLMLCWEIHLFCDRSNIIHLRWRRPRIQKRVIIKGLLIGLPQFFINMSACLVAILMTRSLTHYGSLSPIGGDVAVGAYGISNRLVFFFLMILVGLNQGLKPIAGYNYGAQKYGRLLYLFRLSLLSALVVSVIGTTICLLFSTPLVSLFAKSSQLLVHQSSFCLKVIMITFPLASIQVMFTGFFQTIDEVAKSIFLSLTRQIIFLVPLVLLFPHIFSNSLDAVIYAIPAANILAFSVASVMMIKEVKFLKAHRKTNTTQQK